MSIKLGMEYAKKIKATCFKQTSAKENIGIDELFSLVGEKLFIKSMEEIQAGENDENRADTFKIKRDNRGGSP